MTTTQERARDAARRIVEWNKGRSPACSDSLASKEIARHYVAPFARAEVREALKSAAEEMARMPTDEIGIVSMLDQEHAVEMLRCLARSYGTEEEGSDGNP